jgi:hypothetical protein
VEDSAFNGDVTLPFDRAGRVFATKRNCRSGIKVELPGGCEQQLSNNHIYSDARRRSCALYLGVMKRRMPATVFARSTEQVFLKSDLLASSCRSCRAGCDRLRFEFARGMPSALPTTARVAREASDDVAAALHAAIREGPAGREAAATCAWQAELDELCYGA